MAPSTRLSSNEPIWKQSDLKNKLISRYPLFFSWYFGKVTRENAEKILQEHPPGSYLVRDSETVNKPGAYTISLK